MTHRDEIARAERFAFGDNWARFLASVDERRIATAEESLRVMLRVSSLEGKTFVDVGSGSGLFSLAARRLGATVTSFDYDPASAGCTAELKRRYFPGDVRWTVREGSVLDLQFLATLGNFDVVYSWGVLHHTGRMWEALENVRTIVRPGGQLFLAIYNDQGRASRYWTAVKKLYNRTPRPLRFVVIWPAFLRLWGPTFVRGLLRGKPFEVWRNYSGDRGMSQWRDVIDWVGGYPFEVAMPEQIFEFYRDRGFVMQKMKTCAGGLGCNEYVFSRQE